MHHYKVDENGQMLWANLVIATGQNNRAMNRGILQVAQHYVDGNRLTDGMLNRVEAVIRTFDPCLSCSTHAYGADADWWWNWWTRMETIWMRGDVTHDSRFVIGLRQPTSWG